MGGGVKLFSCQTKLRFCLVELWLDWGFDNNQNCHFYLLISCSIVFDSPKHKITELI